MDMALLVATMLIKLLMTTAWVKEAGVNAVAVEEMGAAEKLEVAVDVVVILVVLLPRLTRGCLFPKLDG